MSDFIYTSNKYSKLYFNIIDNALSRNSIDYYVESHHIHPKSLGGSDSKENLVNLTAREHFICHYLLTKFTIGQDKYKMLCAFQAMGNLISKFTHHRYVNSRLFEHSKDKWIKELREWSLINSPFKKPEIHAKTMKTRKERGTNVFETNNPMHNEESVKKKLESMPDMKGRKAWYNELTGQKKQQINKPEGEGWILRGHKYGLTTKAKGRPKPRIKCPHCANDFPVHTLNRHIKARHGKD